MKRSQDVIKNDLEYICANLQKEFGCLSGKKLLITGGAGFLGYYLIHSLLHWNESATGNQRIQVTVFDNFIRGVPPWMKEVHEDLTITRHDLNHPLPPDMGDFQFIMHAASIASPTYYRKYPLETMDANVNGLRSILEYCRKQKEKRKEIEGIIFYSSSEIYGDPQPEHIPTPETYNGIVSCIGPRACYDESKRYGETLCVNFVKQFDLPVKIVRPFNNYGPGLKITDRRVISDFAGDILGGRDVAVLSDGAPTRTFCYVAEAMIGYYKVLLKGRSGEAYNIGIEEPEISIQELAERMVAVSRELFGYRGKVVHKKSPDQDYLIHNPSRRCPSIAKARSELDYRPSISLDEGLRRSLIWYADHPVAEEA